MHTDCSQQSGDRRVVGFTGRLVLSQDTVTNAFDDTNLGGLFVVQLSQTEGELSEFLDDLRESLSRAGSLEDVGSRGTAVQSRAVVQILHLSRPKTETDFDTPNFTDLRNAFAPSTSGTGGKNDLLIRFDLVALKQPGRGVFDYVAVVGLGNLFNQAGNLSLSRGFLGGSFLLVLLGSASQETWRDHESQKKLVCVVSANEKISLAASHNIPGDNHLVADNGSEAVDLSTKLDFSDLTTLEGNLGIFCVRHQRGVWSHIRTRRDGCRMSNSFFYL